MSYIPCATVCLDSHDLSRAASDSIADLITRFLASVEGMNHSEAGRLVGIHGSYIGEWRDGKIPTRLHEKTRRKLLDALGHPASAGAGAPVTRGSIPEGMDPVTWAAAQFDLLSRMAGDASATLVQHRRARPITPASMDAGTAVVATAARQQGGGRGPAKKHVAR